MGLLGLLLVIGALGYFINDNRIMYFPFWFMGMAFKLIICLILFVVLISFLGNAASDSILILLVIAIVFGLLYLIWNNPNIY